MSGDMSGQGTTGDDGGDIRAGNDTPLEVYSWPTPNGHEVHIMLDECGLRYLVRPIDIGAGAQFAPDFLAISPNNRIPAIVDPAGPGGAPISVFESGACLLYLAENRGRYRVLEWLMFQMGGVGPMLGQAHDFRIYAPEKQRGVAVLAAARRPPMDDKAREALFGATQHQPR